MSQLTVDRKWLESLKAVPGIRSSDYEYAADRTALATFKAIPGADWLVKKWIEFWLEFDRAAFLGSAIRVSEKQFPEVHAHHVRCCELLTLTPPPLFVVERPVLGAFTMGTDDGKSFLVVTRKLLEVVNGRELTYILGHELGHVKSQHVLYSTLAIYLANIGLFYGTRLPGVALLAFPLRLALMAWFRRSEVTCDRAGLVCCQDLEAGRRALLVTGCGSRELADRIDLEEFAKQGEEARTSYGKWGELFITHPYLPKRVKALELFAESHFYVRKVRRQAKSRFVDPADLDKAVGELLGDGVPSVEKTEERSDPARHKAVLALAGAWLDGRLTASRRKALEAHLASLKLKAKAGKELRAYLEKPFPPEAALKEARYFDGDALGGLPYAYSLYFMDVRGPSLAQTVLLRQLTEACGVSRPDAEKLLVDVKARKEFFRERCGLEYCAWCACLFETGARNCPSCETAVGASNQPEEKRVRTLKDKLDDLRTTTQDAAVQAGDALKTAFLGAVDTISKMKRPF